MTGFGSAAREAKGLVVRAELRSVNHRHFQAKLRLPLELAHLESQAEALLRGRLARGSVQASVQVSRAGEAAAARIDRVLLRAYHAEAERAAAELGIPHPGLAALLQLPGVVAPTELEGEDPRLARQVLDVLGEACGELVRMREEEGRALAADLEHCAGEIGRISARIAKRAPQVVRGHRRALQRRIAELAGASAAAAPADLAREIALLADRLDVSEELARLASHLGQLTKLLAKGGPIGRKLDFLAQEFLREANTIGSKSGDARTSHDVIELKTHIERLREQVQNVE